MTTPDNPTGADDGPKPTNDGRPLADRRCRKLPWWHFRRLRGRRMRDRLSEEFGRSYLVERIPGWTFAAAALVLVLTITDGVVTVLLIERGCEEANPLMRYLLQRGHVAFFVGKYLLTAAFLPVALVTHRWHLFGTRLRVGQLVPAVAVLYTLLLVYQFGLWRASQPHIRATMPRPPARALVLSGGEVES